MMLKPLVIAIDGHSSCGKSTLARDLAEVLQITYVDSGAMYRAVTLYLLDNNISHQDSVRVNEALQNIHIDFQWHDGRQQTFLNGKNVEKAIREPRVSDYVSEVSTIPAIRTFLVDLQRAYGLENALVMDGRDIGTVVFPNAQVKLFVTANKVIRVGRRHEELLDRGMDISSEEVEANLTKRDHIDSTRATSPLKMADDAILLDNSLLNREEQRQLALDLIEINIPEDTSIPSYFKQ